jgi:ArsR family transcriptional regulator
MRELTKISKTLTDETRVRMLKLLLERDICVCEMQEIFPLSGSQVSRNLKALMDVGFLKRWHEGKCVVYFADSKNSNRYCKVILEVLADSFNDDPVVCRDREKLKDVIGRELRNNKK